jgi:hypothetical protein
MPSETTDTDTPMTPEEEKGCEKIYKFLLSKYAWMRAAAEKHMTGALPEQYAALQRRLGAASDELAVERYRYERGVGATTQAQATRARDIADREGIDYADALKRVKAGKA